ncbi:MAG: hypothetical protein HQ464_11490 [Planctomycetes bacterium]|nr:hypothetical protein [Planctomycetota bacterium]
MKIAFACQHCAKPLVVDAALAGRTGRCRHCKQRLVVPDGQRESGGSRQAASGKGSADGARPAAQAPVADWRTAVASQLVPPAGRSAAPAGRSAAPAGRSAAPASRADAGPTADTTGSYKLRPVTPVRAPALDTPDWDDIELGAPIAPTQATAFTQPATPPAKRSATPSATPSATRTAESGPSPVFLAYRMFFSLLARGTAWISETSYTVSFIIIILSIASGMIGRHSLAALGCGTIIVLNLIGLSGDIASLVTLSFRKNPLRGALFLVPPFTLYYLWSDWQRYRETVSRMRIPLVTLAVVVAAYLFVPWLHGGKDGTGPLGASVVNRAMGTLEENLGSPRAAVDEGLKAARSWLREMPLPVPSSPPDSDGTNQPAHGRGP